MRKAIITMSLAVLAIGTVSTSANAAVCNINKNQLSGKQSAIVKQIKVEDINDIESLVNNLKSNFDIKSYCNSLKTNGSKDTNASIIIPETTKKAEDKTKATTKKPVDTVKETAKKPVETTKETTKKPVDTAKDTTANTTTNNANVSYAEQVVKLVNAERAKAGLSPVTINTNLTKAALKRSYEIEKSFAHTRPDGSSFSTVLAENGVTYRGAGENIAYGQKSPEEVMNGWMNSAGHRANILNASFTTIGVGYYQNASGVNYWTQLFTY